MALQTIECRVRVSKRTEHAHGAFEIEFEAPYDEEANRAFWEATPSLNFGMQCLNPVAAKALIPGKTYRLVLIPVEEIEHE